jgi:CO/xanthine dehydrogenase Mo-binding subunit
MLKAGAAVGGGLLVSFRLPARAGEAAAVFKPNAWLRITPDDRITFVLDRVEMGQGTMTSHAQLIAEELEVDPTKLHIELAEAAADGSYANPAMGMQVTGGSTSVRTSWDPLRSAGATARRMLESAAAATWNVPVEQCVARDGAVTSGNNRATYGQLCERAATMRAAKVAPKTKDFRVIGKSIGRLDARQKVTGTGVFGIDVKVKGALTAVVVRCPVPGGSPRRHDDSAVKAMPGVKHVVTTPNGIAILADNYWNARNAAAQLKVQWNEGAAEHLSTRSFRENARARAKSEAGQKARAQGDLDAGRKAAVKTVEAVYEVPWVAHAPMEPINATADVQPGRCEVWASTQAPSSAQIVAAKICGLTPEQVTVHQTLVGGGFGRRIAQDAVAEAVLLSKAVKAPVKVQWSREDDLRNGIYRPAAYNVLEGGVTESGEIAFWQHKIVAASIMAQVGGQFVGDVLPFGAPEKLKTLAVSAVGGLLRGPVADPTAVEGAADFEYDMPNLLVRYVMDEPGVPIGFLRSVGHSHNGFIVEGFVDELAAAAGKDPLEFRRAMLKKAPRNLGVLELAASKAQWGSALPEGRSRGIAQHHSFDSWAAAVAEVSVEGNTIKVHRLVVAIDCGQVVNPGLVRAQLESASVFGLSMALKQRITFDKGRVVQSNFHDYPIIRMNECPEIETHLVESTERPTGVGEPMVPVIAPAVANAVFAATGKRLRSMPFSLEA